MVRTARIAGLSAALCLLAAAPAHAAFFPDLTVGVAPATAGGTPALAASISQPATNTPIERFTLALPAGFSPTGAPGASVCGPVTLRMGACPPQTRIGTYLGNVGGKTPLAGGIFKTSPSTFGFSVSVLGGAVSQVVGGAVLQRASGALDVKVDRLPALPLTQLQLGFYGGQRSLVRAPTACAAYTIDGKFTSRAGDLAIDRSTVAIRGCDGVPAVLVANVRMTSRRFASGGSIYGARTVIAWWASQAVEHTAVRIERRVDGAWRKAGVLVATGNAGDNFVQWDGRLRGRRLEPGKYALRVKPAGSAPTPRLRFRIVG